MSKDDGNTKSKKKEASSASLSGSRDATGLRRSNRETPSKKQTTASPSSNGRRSERIENQTTTPNTSPFKKKPDKIEEQMGPSPLRRSDRSKKQQLSPNPSGSKKLVDVSPSSNIKSKKEKAASSQKEDDVSVDNKNDNVNEREDSDVGGRKRKRMTVHGYKSLFKPQKLRIEAEDGQDLNGQHTPPESGRTTESDNGEKQIGGKCSQDNNGKMSTQNTDIDACSKEERINNSLTNKQELETCDKDLHDNHTSKVRKTCQESGVMENTENSDSKFVEFWIPVQLSNVQLEQYCSTLLSGAMALRSFSKGDSLGALHNILLSNRKCCDHPYALDDYLQIQTLITKDQPKSIHWKLGYRASGKVNFLDQILPEVKKRKLRLVILFQPTVATGTSKSTHPLSIGDILDDFFIQEFGEHSYVRIDGAMEPSHKQTALDNFNTDMNRFVCLLDTSQSSIKLSSVDIIIIFNSDLNPANDIKPLQKMSIDSNSKQIMIFRLYSKNTLEEKILKLAEQNVPESKLQNLNRNTCHALLMWGAKDLFKKLETFHSKSGKEIYSEETFLNDVKEEFLYIISNKCKSKDGEKSLIRKVQNCGYYGNKNMPYSEVKTQLCDGEQPRVFWRNLLDGKYPQWNFVPLSTSRQRKRPQIYGDTSDTIAPVADVVKKRRKSPAALKPVIEKEPGGANEGGHNESQSSSGGHFWSISVRTSKSLPELVKPTVYDLCKILKFPADVTNTVDKFLDFVLENYNVSKEHTSTLQAFMISLCWIGALILKHEINRNESFELAKKHLNFECKEQEVNTVYLKLEEAKETFLKQTENQEKQDDDDGLKAPPQAICTESTEQKVSMESQHNQNVEMSIEENMEISKETEKFKREWNEKRANLELDYTLSQSLIRLLHVNPSIRSEKLLLLDKQFANKMEEHEKDRDIHLKDLKSTLQAADMSADVAADNELPLRGSRDGKEQGVENHDRPETSVSVGSPNGGGDKMTKMPLELDGGNVQDQSKERGSLGIGDDIESTSSHTSEKQMVDATVESSLPFVENPPHQHESVHDDVAGVVNGETPGKKCDGIENNVERNADSVEVDSNKENGNGDNSGADMADFGETGAPGGAENRENGEDGNINHEKSQAVEEQNDSCGSSSNQPSAGVPHDDTPSVQPIASQAPDHPTPTILETENESLLEQLLDIGIQEKEGQTDPNPEETHVDPMAENQPDTHPVNESLPETTCENDANAPGTVNNQQSVEQHNSTQNTTQPEINLFDLHNHVPTRIPNHGDPLQAELEQLYTYKDNVAKFYEDTKQKLKSDCEKEIAEMVAQIKRKYEGKIKEAEIAFQLRKMELDTTVDTVVMNKLLAEAFRAKCQDITPSSPGMQKVAQSGLMQQLHRFSVRPSSSPGQTSGRQQTPPSPPPSSPSPPPPPPPPPLQIVHQPAALFSTPVIRPPPTTTLRPPSTTPIRPPPTTTFRPPSTTPIRPPPTINPPSPTTRPPPNITSNTRPPPTITPLTPTTRPPPNITPLTPSAGTLRGPAPHLRSSLHTDIRAPAPHLRPFRPSTSASPDITRRMPPGQQPPLPPEMSYVPPPQNHQIHTSGGVQYDLLDLTDIFPEDNTHPSSGHDLVCLSDDD